jgi:hypothetical protein
MGPVLIVFLINAAGFDVPSSIVVGETPCVNAINKLRSEQYLAVVSSTAGSDGSLVYTMTNGPLPKGYTKKTAILACGKAPS